MYEAAVTVVGASMALAEKREADLVCLAAGDLVYAYTGGREDLAEGAIFTPPACSFKVEHRELNRRTPVVIYVVPKSATSVAMTK